MALSKTTEVKGLTIQSAYHRVQKVAVTKDTLVFSVEVSADASSAPISMQALSCEYDLSGENAIKQAYEHLKTLPEFADAEDA